MDMDISDTEDLGKHSKTSSSSVSAGFSSSSHYAINLFENVTIDELNDHVGMVGKHIQVYWDGDKVFYPAVVRGYVKESGVYLVVYDGDGDSAAQTAENLKSQPLNYVKVWRGDDEQYDIYRASTEPKSAYPKRKAAQNVTYNQQALERAALEQYRVAAGFAPRPSLLPGETREKKTKKKSYMEMIMEAIEMMKERGGSSLQSIRKYLKQNNNIDCHEQSFLKKSLTALQTLSASDTLEKVGHQKYKISSKELEYRKLEAKQRKKDEKEKERLYREKEWAKQQGGVGRNPWSRGLGEESFTGTAIEHNKIARKEIVEQRARRDRYLEERVVLLRPFLQEKNYFYRLQERERLLKIQEKAQAALPSTTRVNIYKQKALQTTVKNTMEEMLQFIDPLNQRNKYMTTSIDSIKYMSKKLPKAVLHRVLSELVIELASEAIEEPVEEYDPEEDAENEAVPIDETVHSQVAYALRGVEMVEQSSILKAVLHDHQIQGISWMVHMFNNGMPMILGDQMGLGKTIQTIGFLAHLKTAQNRGGPHLVVVPLSVMSNWISEIEKFCPTFRAVRLHGPKSERLRIMTEEIHDYREFDIVVTTFEMLVAEVNFFKRKYMWTTIIVDEGHRLKNEKSQLSEKLKSIPALSKIILTGTPLQNNLRELWALIHFLSPDVFSPSTKEFFDDGFDLHRGHIDSNILRRARKLLCVFMLRRVKDQVNIRLPSKKELTVLVPLTKQQITWYKQLLCGLDSDTIETVMRESTKGSSGTNSRIASSDDLVTSINGSSSLSSSSSSEAAKSKIVKSKSKENLADGNGNSGGDSDWRKLMNLLLQLRKVCNHTYLMPDGAPEPYRISESIVQGSGKLKMLDRMLPKLKEDDHRVLIFSQFTSMLDILEDYCELREYVFVRLDGETNRVQRRLDVRRYNAPKSPIFIFLISTRAGGLGLNLASADTVILYDSDWNPQVDLQAMERAHRIGQTKPVRVFRLICQGSIEERMVSRAEKKLFLNAMVAEADVIDDDIDESENINENSDNVTQALGIGGASMSKNELASLIRFGANAIVDSKASGSEMKDNDLNILLEREYGRDNLLKHNDNFASTSTEDGHTAPAAVEDPLEAAQAALRDRLEMLEEVDIRQLGGVLYQKKKVVKKGSNDLDETDILDEFNFDGTENKRQRKTRIVMIDGKGSGYGGAVPVLHETMDVVKDDSDKVVIVAKQREWSHQCFCMLCGKGRGMAESGTKCAHCPLSFHIGCMATAGLTREKTMFICPHHKCVACTRTTASAGGMLFRCIGCLTSYCEDCLPQDEIDSVGRFKLLKELGYDSKQSYYIKCPSCLMHSGEVAKGVFGDQNMAVDDGDNNGASSEGGVAAILEGDGDGEGDELFPSQLMRLVWEEVPDSEDERSRRKKGKKGKKGRKASSAGKDESPPKSTSGRKRKVQAESEDDDDEDDDDSDSGKKRSGPVGADDEFYETTVPVDCSPRQCIQILQNHSKASCLDINSLPQNKRHLFTTISFIELKLHSNKFRSVKNFAAEIRALLVSLTKFKVERDIAAKAAVLLYLFDNKIIQNLSENIDM